MKRWIYGVVMILAVFLAAAGTAFAAGSVIEGGISKTAGGLEIARGTTVNGDVTVNAGEIVIYGVVNGSVSGNMGQITVYGDVNGDVDANMGQVTISGNVSGSVGSRMGEVVVNGFVAQDVTAGLGSVQIRGTVGGDVQAGLGEVNISGEVLGSVHSRGGNISIGGAVGGDVTLTRGIVELGPRAVITGTVTVEEGLVRISDGAVAGSIQVITELTEQELRRPVRSDRWPRFAGLERVIENIGGGIERTFRNLRIIPDHFPFRNLFPGWVPFQPMMSWPGSLARGLLNMIVLFALAALTTSLFPRHVQNVGKAVQKETGAVFGWGLLAAVLAVPLMVLLVITVVGIPLAIVEVVALAVAGLLGYTAIAQLLGDQILKSQAAGSGNSLGALALGILILGVVGMIPLVGWLASMLLSVAAIGAVLTARFGTAARFSGAGGEAVDPGDGPES